MDGILAKRRAYARFDISARVEYVIDNHKYMALSRNLSAGGMLLGGSTQLVPLTQMHFSLTLPDLPTSMSLMGSVVRVGRKGAQIQFDTSQSAATDRIHAYVERKVIPTLERDLLKSGFPAQKLFELASFYAQEGESQRAMDLYRNHQDTRGGDRTFLEKMIWLWIEELSVAPPAQRQILVNELARLCKKADGINSHSVEIAKNLLLTFHPETKPETKDSPTYAAPSSASTTAHASLPRISIDEELAFAQSYEAAELTAARESLQSLLKENKELLSERSKLLSMLQQCQSLLRSQEEQLVEARRDLQSAQVSVADDSFLENDTAQFKMPSF